MEVELQPRTQYDEEEQENYVSVLAPTDQGADAWKFLFACFLVEASLWGFCLAFGVFQDHYSRQPQFGDTESIASIGTIATSMYFLGAPFMAPMVKRYNQWRRHMVVAGSLICILSLLGASFANSVAALITSQGVLYGLGFLLLYFPLLSMLNEWFVQRRGFAYGVLYAGGGFSSVGLPFLLQWLLSNYGHRTTLRIVAIAQFIIIAPILPLLKGRLPPSHHNVLQPVDLAFFKRPLFWIFAISNLCQGFAYYIPSLYLPTFASFLGLSGTQGALLLSANNLASIVGQVGFGYLSDQGNNIIFVLIFISTFVASISVFAIWGFAQSLGTLLVFSLIYGLSAGAYVVFWPKFGTMLSEDPQPIFCLMAFGKGIGNIVTGPISSSLLSRPMTSGYGMGKFEPVIVYVGSLMLCSSLGVIGWPMRRLASQS